MAKRKRPGLIGPLVRIGAAVALGMAAKERIAKPDEQARSLIADRRNQTLDQVMPSVTDLGSTYAIAGAAATLLFARRKRLARDVAVAGSLAWIAAQAAKPLFKRPRPYDVGDVARLVRKPAGMSYPSGHPAVAAAIARVLDPAVAEPARGLIAKMPKLVAFSRVYVGVHYPSDVIGGTMLGRAIGDLWLRYRREREPATGRRRERP